MLNFDTVDLAALESCENAALDELDFGVVGMSNSGTIDRYNRWQSKLAALAPEKAIDRSLFTEVAPCTNNFMVAQRFENEESLNERFAYMFTVKMRPTKVELRLLKAPGTSRVYMLVRKPN